MPSITVKNIPVAIYDRVRELAEANRRSINSQIIVILEQVVGSRPLDTDALLEEARLLRERTADYIIGDEELRAGKAHGRR